MSKEEMREGFEAWHCEQYKTKHMTGAPTRDMHNGVRAEKYGPKKQQALWECWQETGGDVAKVEALKDEIERIEAGKQPVAWFRSDALGCAVWKPGATQALKDGDPLFTRSDAGEVEQLRRELSDTREAFLNQSARLVEAGQRNAELVAAIVALPDEFKELSGCENTAGVYACIDYISDWVAELAKPTESGASE